MRNKKAQSGMNAAMLIAILAALIIVYIIFLPSDDRLELIGENDSNSDSTKDIEKILVEDTERIMENIGQKEIEHDLSSINLYTSTEASVIKEENTLYVKNGWFDKQEKTVEFKVSDPDNTNNILISFDAKKAKGQLLITINNREVYNNEIEKVNIDPIRISSDLIAENNEINIQVSGVGAAFWSTNEYLLENFKITADITDTSTRESEIRFILTSSEVRNIEKSEIRFVPECDPTSVGLLEIMINKHMVYSSIPDCGTARPLDFSPMHLITGENKLEFRTEKGRYLIDQIKITNELKETPSYTYFFDLDNEDIKSIEEGEKSVNLTMYFVDDIEYKEAEIIINGGKTYMTRHKDIIWGTSLDRFVEEGSNSLKIIPEKNMEIRKLLVALEED